MMMQNATKDGNWNTLLCENDELLFKNYSKEYFRGNPPPSKTRIL